MCSSSVCSLVHKVGQSHTTWHAIVKGFNCSSCLFYTAHSHQCTHTPRCITGVQQSTVRDCSKWRKQLDQVLSQHIACLQLLSAFTLGSNEESRGLGSRGLGRIT